MRKCSEVMTMNPACCVPNDTVAKVAQMMRSKDIGPVPIIENEQAHRLVRIVTDRRSGLESCGRRARCQNHDRG